MSHTHLHRYERHETPFPLGRHVEHDSRSRSHTFAIAPTPAVHTSVVYPHHAPVLNQGQVGSCHDPETEILTRQGWLPFPDLTADNELATVDPETCQVIFEKPVRVIAKHYVGDMHYVENSSKNFAVTADHKMLVRKWDERARTLKPSYEFVDMADIGWYSGLMTSVSQTGGSDTYTIPGIVGYKRASQRQDAVVPMSVWLNFLGIYLAEGTMISPSAKCPNKVQIAASKERERCFVKTTLDALGLNYCALKDRFTFENARIYRHLEELGLKGVHAPQKFVPRFVFEQSSEMIEELLRGHREGDGTLIGGTWSHFTSSHQLAEDLQELAFLAGYKTGRDVRRPPTSVMKDGRRVVGRHPAYVVRALKGKLSSIERGREVRVEHYDGMVYCAEVPTHHTLVTRRRGKILISGNCTGNAMAQLLNCVMYEPARVAAAKAAHTDGRGFHGGGWLTEADALELYSLATHLDGFGPSQYYPPHDDGSTGLAVAKAAQQKGYLSAYQHCYTMAQVQAALASQPVIAGTAWTQPMFTPDPITGIVAVGALNDTTIVGGHEYLIQGIDYQLQCLVALNSWGDAWGGGHGLSGGQFRIRFADFTNLLATEGDVIAPTGMN